MEWSKLVAAGNATVAKINPPMRGPFGLFAPGPPRVGWSPCVDGRNITLRSFFDVAPEISKNVPTLIGSVSEEGSQMSWHPTEEEWRANLTKAYGEQKASVLIAVLKKSYPKTVAGLAAVLPSLRTGEAIVSGEAVALPVRALLPRPRPEPHAEDPYLEPWRAEPATPDLQASLKKWRGIYEGEENV
jgi:hypothetical protein